MAKHHKTDKTLVEKMLDNGSHLHELSGLIYGHSHAMPHHPARKLG